VPGGPGRAAVGLPEDPLGRKVAQTETPGQSL